MNSCRSFIFFESRKGRNLYIWVGRYPNGPTVKYFVENCTIFVPILLSTQQQGYQDERELHEGQ
jgi:hypothetical protein